MPFDHALGCDRTVVTFVRGLGATWRSFLTTAGAVTVLLYGCATVYGQSTGDGTKRPIKTVSIPLVGCPSFGQIEVLEAPKGTSEPVPIKEQEGQALAYYKSADGISILAPRGWYCQGASGSGGAALFLGPSPIINSSAGWEGLGGAAMEVNDISGENSGRYEIAELIARVFPAYRSFARRVWDLDSSLPSGPYPKDTLTYRGNAVVEYRTPPQTEGLGTFTSLLGKNDLPIAGAAILLIDPSSPVGDIPHLMLLSVRFPPDLARLAPVIIRYAEREAAVVGRK
jgi:hypothetical protein